MSAYAAVRFVALGVAGCINRTVLMLSVALMARLLVKELLTVVKVTAVTIRFVVRVLQRSVDFSGTRVVFSGCGTLSSRSSPTGHCPHRNRSIRRCCA